MLKSFLISSCLGLMLSSPLLARSPVSLLGQELDLCQDGIDGLPNADLSELYCQIRRQISEWSGQPLSELSQGLVQEIHVAADISWKTTYNDASALENGALTLKIPSQQIDLRVVFAKGPKLNGQLTISPELRLTGQSICNLKVGEAKIGLLALESNLEPWLNKVLKDGLNEDPALEDLLLSRLNQLIDDNRQEHCQPLKTALPPPPDLRRYRHDLTELKAKYQRYLRLGQEQLDSEGWPKDTHCDGLLFTGLYAAAGGRSPLGKAEDPAQAGRYFRHWQQNCYANYLNNLREKSSVSTISRDMLKGLAMWMWHEGEAERLADMIRFGQSQSLEGFPLIWIVGEGQIGRVDMPPSLMQTFLEMHEKMNGEAVPEFFKGSAWQVWEKCIGYRCHLTALHILLRWRIHGEIDDRAEERLRWLVQKEPRNALYAAILGLTTGTGAAWQEAMDSLLNPQWFPSSRLPSSADRCSFYIFERDYIRDGKLNHHWQPCPEQGRTFTGVDFLFASSLLLEGAKTLYGIDLTAED